MTAVLAPALQVNDRYIHISPGLTQAIYLPSGCWAVKVRKVNDLWLAFAAPRAVNSGAPFALASGPDEREVFTVARRWAESAETLGMHPGRVRFAGYGNADAEQVPA